MGEEDLGNSPEQNTAPQTTGEESLAPQPEPTVKPPTPTTAEELVRQAQNLPRLPSTADEPRGFRLNYGEVYSKPGTRYNLLGQKIYDPPPLSYDGRLTLDNTPQENQTSTVSRNVGIQTRGLNVITAVNQSTVADFSTRLFNRLGNSLQDNLGNSAEQGLALTGARNIAQPRTIQSTLLDTLTNMGRKSPEAVSMPAASRASSGVYLSSYAQRNANPQSVLALYNEIAKLKSTLGNGIDSIEIQYADRVVNGQLQRVAVGVRVGVKNYNELYDGLGLYGQSAYTSVGRSHYFNFTVNQTGQVIETTSNRLITGSLISSSGGAGGRLSAFNTVKGLISTYVKSAELEAKHGVVDSLFNAMVSRGDYSPLGRVFAEMLISRDETFIVNKGNRFNRTVETILNAKGFSGLEADLNRVIDSISAKGLNYYHTIGQVMQDMNNDPQAVKEAYSKMYSQRRAALRRALDPLYKVASFRGPSFESSVRATLKNLNLLVSSDTEVFEYSVDGKQIKLSIFDDLKAAALGMSPVGKAKYDFRKNQASSSILQLLMSPYLMPHETGYSGAQAVARLGFYNMSETRGGRSMYQILPAMYRHGFAGTQPGEYYKPIAAQSAKSSLVKYTAGYFNFDAASHKVVEFFDNSVLFRGMPSLMRSSLKEVKLHLERIGYNNAQEVIREFRTRMNLKEDEDENTEILLTPFRKPEQISQRLKNLVGGRSMYELSTSVRSALKEQNQSAINNLFEDTQDGLHFSASYLAGEVPANLNTIQYEYVLRERAKIIQELNYNETQLASDVDKQLDVSNRLVKRLREIQLDPFKDVGGLVIGRATRRAAVGMGISALSDFMFVNQEYLAKSSFGYSHVVNYNIPKTTSTYYEGVGNVRQVDPYFEAKVERYKQVFKAGTTIYMNAHELKNEGALAALNTAAGVFRQQLKDRGLSGESLTRAIRTQLLNNFSALQSVDITEEGLQATLKPGAYRFDSTGIMRFEGEIVDGSLRIGLLPKRGKYTSLGGGVLNQQYASEFIDLKVAGLSRGITDGIAFVLSDVKFKPGQGGGVEPEVALTILTDFATGSRHDSLTKGPIVATKGYDAFNDVFRSSLLSRQAKADPIYGVMGPSVFKSYNYESGLEILRDLQSKTSLLNIDSREKVFLLSLAFLDKNNGELKQALLDYVDNSSLKNKPALKLLVQSYQGSGPKKLQNLLINAPDVITLLGGGQLNKIGGYLAKLLQSGNFNDFESKLQTIFQRADESSVEIIRQVEGKSVSLRTYRESDFSVRSAALIADILYTTQQIINPNLQLGKITGGKPLEGYNFINADGQVRVQDFVSNAAFREATLDIAQKLGYRNKFLPSQKTLTAAIERGLQPGDKLYKKVQELLLAVHYSFQTSPFIERAVNLMPSRVLYPTGSEDAVGLEYHYSLSMSQREFNQLRGIGVDVESFSQVQAAYSTIVTHGSANRISRLMEVVSPFGADRTQVNLSQKVAQLLDNYNRFSAEHKFLGSGRNLSLLDQLVRQLTLGSDKYNTTLSQYELVNQAINYQQPGTQYEQTKALNVINVLEPGRLQLESLQDSQLVDLAKLYNIHSLNRAEIIESLRALGPITGQAVQYYGLSSNVDDPRRLSVSRAISEYAETRTAFGGDLLYGLSEDSVRTFLQNNAVDYQTFKSAIDLVTNPITGRLATGKNTYDIVNRLQEHDANIEKMLANAAGANKTKTYVQALERIASGAQQVINYSDNALQKERAFRLRQEIFQTRSILLPSMEVFGLDSDPMIMLYDPSEGRRHITYEATPIIQLGLDVLSEIPTEFESYTNEVIRNQQRIRELLPEFQSIMGRLHEGPILKATVEEAKLIKEIQSLAIQSQSDVEQIFGSVLQQRAENEKIKYPGASFIAVASYLATPSEAFTGGRVFGGSLGEVVTSVDKLTKDQYEKFIYSSTSRLDDLDSLEDPRMLNSIRNKKLWYFKEKLKQQRRARELHRLIHAEVDFSYDPKSYKPPAFADDVASFLDLLSADARFLVYKELLEAEQDKSPGIKLGVKQEMDLNRQQKAILDEQIELLTAERDRLNRRLENLKVAKQGFTGSGGLVKNLANVKAEMLGLKDSLYAQHLEAKKQKIKLNEQADYLYNSIIATLKRNRENLIKQRKLAQHRLEVIKLTRKGQVKSLIKVKGEILGFKDGIYAQHTNAKEEGAKLYEEADTLYKEVISPLKDTKQELIKERKKYNYRLSVIKLTRKGQVKSLTSVKEEILGLKDSLYAQHAEAREQRIKLIEEADTLYKEVISPLKRTKTELINERKLLQRRLTSLRVAERGVRGSGGLVKNLTTVKSEILALKDSLYAQSVDARNKKAQLKAQADVLYTGVISRLNEYRTDVNQRRREISLKLKATSKQIKDKHKELDANKRELNELFQYKKDLLDQRNTLNARLRAVQQDNLSPIEKETLKFLTDRAASLQRERQNVQLQLKEINKTLKLEYKDLHQQEISIKQQLKSVRAQLKSIHPESSKIQSLSLTLATNYITEKPEAAEIVKGWYLNKSLQASERKLVTDLENIRTLRTQGNPARQTLLDKLEDINKREKQNKEVLDNYYAEPLVEALSKIGTSISLLDESISEKLKYKSNLHEMISQMQSYQSGLRERTDKLGDELHVINTELSLQHEELKRINEKRRDADAKSRLYADLLNAFKQDNPKFQDILDRGDFEPTTVGIVHKFKLLSSKKASILAQLEAIKDNRAFTLDSIKTINDNIGQINTELRFRFDQLNTINDKSRDLKLESTLYTGLLEAFKLEDPDFQKIKDLAMGSPYEKTVTSAIYKFKELTARKLRVLEQLEKNSEKTALIFDDIKTVNNRLSSVNTELRFRYEQLTSINEKRQDLKLESSIYTELLTAFKSEEPNFQNIIDKVKGTGYEKTVRLAKSEFEKLTARKLRVLAQLETNSEKAALAADDIKIITDDLDLVNSELRFQYESLNNINDKQRDLKLESTIYTELLNAFKSGKEEDLQNVKNLATGSSYEKTVTSAIHRFNLISSKRASIVKQLKANQESRSEVIAQIKPIHSRLKKLKQVRAALNQRFFSSLKPLKENLYAKLSEAEDQKRSFENIRREFANLESDEVYRSDLSRRLSSKNLSIILETNSGLQQVHVFGRPFLEGIGLHAQGGAFIIQDRLRQHVVSIRKRAAAGDAEARELLNALTNPELVAGLSEKNKVFYDEFKNIVESKKSAEDTQTRYQKELSQIQEAIAKYNPIETYRATGTPNLSKSHTRAAGLELALLSRGIPSPVKKTYSAGEVREFAFRKKDADIIEREKIKYNSRVAAFQDYTKYINDRQGQAEAAALERISQMTGYVHRAGGLTGASQGTNMLHNVKDIPEIISRGEANSNQLSLTLDGNHTALIVSMYGRFGVHGGDFDGDSYQLIFGYRDIQESLLKAIRNRDTIRSSLATIENTDASDSTYLAYLDNKKADLRQSLQSAQAAVDDLVNRVNEFSTITSGRIKQGMRRHVAAFAGIPLSIIMNEDYYSDEQISNMIEQQRGITPGLTDIGSDYASTGDYFRLAGRLADRLGPTATKNQALTAVDTLFSGEDTGLVNQFKLLLSASSAFEGDVSNIKEKFFEEISEMTNLQVALATANKFIESSAGSIFDLRTFEALQTSIGSVGTSLIGEGYNAITTMIGRSVMARTLGTVIQDSIQTPSPDSFVNRLIQKLDNLSSDSAITNIKESAQNVKGKFVDYELERTQHFTQERGQRLQMNLGLIQQIIRDSLKPKEKQGVIDALVKGNTSVRDKLLDESLDDTTRTNILRDFLSTQAVTSMVDMISPKALDKNIDVTKTTTGGLINTFGAIFLLADYTREQNPAKFLAQGSGDRYNVLRRYRDIYTNPDVYKTGGHNLDIVTQLRLEDQEFVGKIRSDDNYLVRQAITDMINMATAQEAFSKYAGYDEGTWIDQAKARRESYLKALADVNSESPLHFKNEQHRVAVMRSMHISDLDINAYKQNQVADHTFDLESARLSLLNVSYVESTYLGMTEADVEFSRKVTRAAGELKNMSYETKESFVPFIAAQNENAVAIQQMARRGKLQDPVAMRDFQVGSAARLFDAIDRVNSNLTVKYGNLENAMSKTDVYQAYSQIADLSGVFDLNAQDSETLSFALMASKEDSQALFKHLANVSAGQAYVLEKGRQLDSIYEKYQNADDSSRLDLDRQRSLIDEDLYLLKEALNNNVNSPELQSRLAEVGERERLRMTEESKGRRMARLKLRDELKALPTQQSMHSFGVMNTLELFAAPVVGSVLMQQPLNERLIMGTYDILQGLATVESFSSNAVAAEANRLFRISRFKDHIMQNESLLLGAAQGFLAESVYMGLASFVSSRAEALSQRFNPKGRQGGGGIGGVVAEAAVTAAALAFTRRGNEYGIDNKPYRNLAAEALLGIADETEEAVSSWLDKAMDIQVETEDQIVTFDFDPSTTPSQYEERIVTGWVDMTYSDDSMGPNSFDSVYYEAGSYLAD